MVVSFTQVRDADRRPFLAGGSVSRREQAVKDPQQLQESMALPVFGELWDYLSRNPTLGEIAEIHRGVEWQAPFSAEAYTSAAPRRGFRRGLLRIPERYCAFVTPPDEIYLSTLPQHRRGGAFDLPWEKPKIVANAARLSRGMWRIAAFADHEGLICSQRFHGIWPQDLRFLEVIEAIINGPLANAFVAAFEGMRDIGKGTLTATPIPHYHAMASAAIAKAVCDFRNELQSWWKADEFHRSEVQLWRLENLLLAIDAAVLKAYDLPPRLERELLDAFHGEQRRVPFPFTEYFDRDFVPHLPLWMTLSPQYEASTAARLRQHLPQITDPALAAALEEVE